METADSFFISGEEAGNRLDKIIAARYRDVRSRTFFQNLIQDQKVLINQEPVKKRIEPKEGDLVEILFALSEEMKLEPEPIPLDVLYEDQFLVLINKPPGLVVHPAPGNWSGTLVNALLYHCKNWSGIPTSFSQHSPPRPGVVHRLDKDTSGVILMGKNEAITAKLSTQFAAREVYKEYVAVCIGNPGTRTIDLPLARHPVHRKQMAVLPDGRPSITHCASIAHDEKFSFVRLVLETGRTHQIRVHLKAVNCPILGDPIYGNTQTNERLGISRPLLHARVLRFTHPITGEKIEVTAPLPKDIDSFIRRF